MKCSIRTAHSIEAFQAVAIKEVLALQMTEAMKAQGLSRNVMAKRMHTSRSQISRLLDPADGNVDAPDATTSLCTVGAKSAA